MPERNCFAATVIFLVITAISLGIGVAVSSDSTDSTVARLIPTTAPTLMISLEPTPVVTSKPTPGPYMQDLAGIVLLPGKDVQDLDVSDPEFMALKWMAESDVLGVPLKVNSTELLERFALVTLYYATSGDEMWSSSFFWLLGNPHCTWDMIDCSADDSVRGISMESNNLAGTLPLAIFWNLKNVETVNFGSNFLTGGLPAEIGNMPRLEYLKWKRTPSYPGRYQPL